MHTKTDMTTWGGLFATVASLMGLSTLELTYLILAVLGFLISALGWWDRRRTNKTQRHVDAERLALDRERTRALVDYLSKSDRHTLGQADDVIAKVDRVLKEAEQ